MAAPDLPSTGPLIDDAYLKYPPNPRKFFTEPPANGGEFSVFSGASSGPPTPLDQNPAWREVNRQLNATARINLVSNRLRERTVRFRSRFSELAAPTARARRGGL